MAMLNNQMVILMIFLCTQTEPAKKKTEPVPMIQPTALFRIIKVHHQQTHATRPVSSCRYPAVNGL